MKLKYRRIHLIGAGGAGMSAIAKILAGLGHEVTGSDLRGGPVLERLEDYGVRVHVGSDPSVAEGSDLVVASSAVPDRDSEIVAATRSGVPVWRRPELLSALTSVIPTIGATGTHGKTSTTALLIWAIRGLGFDPSFIVGGDLAGINTNGHLGTSDLLVIEADEAFRTFESLHLNGLVVTNVEAEHVDHFGGVDDLSGAFEEVVANVDGPVVACSDDSGASHLSSLDGVTTYGFGDTATWRILEYHQTESGLAFHLSGPGTEVDVALARPGRHMAQNAAGALALVAEMGHPVPPAAVGLSGFKGVGRRFEHRGTIGGVMLVDDYAHHPTEVRATLDAAQGLALGRTWAVFQPHLYSRTRRHSADFALALSKADVVVVTDDYGAREEPEPGVTGELITRAVSDGTEVHYVPHRADLAGFLSPRLNSGDLVITMGAGDITLVPTELAAMLAVSRG